VRSPEKEHELVEEVVVVVVVGVPPVSDAWTFAIVDASAPKDVRSDRID
jgi:hypothetical protein